MSKIVFLFSLLLAVVPAWSRQVESSEIHFLFGYQAFLNKDFTTCIREFNLSLEQEKKKHQIAKVILFESICKAKLNEKDEAAYAAVRIKTKYLSSWDRRHFVRLKKYLNVHFDRALEEKLAKSERVKKLFYLFLAYDGRTSYSAHSQKKDAHFTGLTARLSYLDWSLDINIEKYRLIPRHDFQGFSQTQGHLGITRRFTDDFSLTGRYTNLSSNTRSQDAIQIYGMATSYQLFARTKILADFYHSTYPKSTVGHLSVWQTDLSLHQDIYKFGNVEFWINTGAESTQASSGPLRSNLLTINERVNWRSFFDLNGRFSMVYLTLGFWGGRELYGIRNNGTMVFSTAEEHLGGQYASARYDLNNRSALSLNYFRENIRIVDVSGSSNTLMGTYTYHYH
jgi:hypothetical protein